MSSNSLVQFSETRCRSAADFTRSPLRRGGRTSMKSSVAFARWSRGIHHREAAVALALFVLWPPLNGLFLKTEARQVFLDPGFLMLAGLLGGCSTAAYLLTGSIWPSTLVHWITVVGWKAFLGGRIFD